MQVNDFEQLTHNECMLHVCAGDTLLLPFRIATLELEYVFPYAIVCRHLEIRAGEEGLWYVGSAGEHLHSISFLRQGDIVRLKSDLQRTAFYVGGKFESTVLVTDSRKVSSENCHEWQRCLAAAV